MKKKPSSSSKKKSKNKARQSQLTKINLNAAGIDLGAREHWVCVSSEATPEIIVKK